MRILVFGDSITQGLFDKQGGWVARLQAEANQKALKDPELMTNENRVLFFNLGIAGDRLEEVVKRFKSEVENRLRTDESIVIVLSTGLNDACLIDNRVVSDEQDFQDVYGRLIDEAQDYTEDVICVGIASVDESIVKPTRERFGMRTWSNNRINLFEDCIKQIAFSKQVTFVPIHDEFLEKQKHHQLLTSDGLHPSTDGHEFIAKKVGESLSQLLS